MIARHHYTNQEKAARTAKQPGAVTKPSVRVKHCVAVMVSSKNGETTITDTIRSALGQADVYVVSDGSTDRTVEAAAYAGASVLALETNIGKPNALKKLNDHFQLTAHYSAIAILDDDTRLEPNFIEEALKVMFPAKPRKWKAGIVVGRTNTLINHNHRWNVWLLFRAYAHWRYQMFYRRGQSILNAMNCISGSNSIYTADVLDHVLIENPPYAVDDTWWTLEVRRNEQKLGRIVYAHKAIAWICDPLTMKAWYKQSLRWMWGMMQGARGHKVGRKLTWFDFTYGLMVMDWLQYVTGASLLPGLLIWGFHFSLLKLAIWYLAGVYIFALMGVFGTRYWRILIVVPVFLPMDFLFRLVLVHAFVKTVRQPTVSTNVWESPGRYELEGGV